MPMKASCDKAKGRAEAIHASLPRWAPISGSVPSSTASNRARISASSPSSGNIHFFPQEVVFIAMPLAMACATSLGM